MLTFRELTIEDKSLCEQYLQAQPSYLCEHSFVDIFIWSPHYETQMAIEDGFLFLKVVSFPDKHPGYICPVGTGDLAAALQKLEEHAAAQGAPLTMASISAPMKAQIEALCPDRYVFTENRDGADYIYDSAALISLAGKKLHAKRNFINRFQDAYAGRWTFEPITKENIPAAFAFHLKWCEQNGCADDQSFLGETCAIGRAFKFYDQLGLKGGILRVDGEVVAFTLGAQANKEMFVVQIEKADSDFPGSYPMINQQFVAANCQDIPFINREEDMGLEGLRKAKLSYRPAFLAEEFSATLA